MVHMHCAGARSVMCIRTHLDSLYKSFSPMMCSVSRESTIVKPMSSHCLQPPADLGAYFG